MAFVASHAFHFDVLAAQRIFSVAVMLEGASFPVFFVMAGFAFLPVLSLMLIFFQVAGDTGGFQLIPIVGVGVASGALSRLVLVAQGEFGVLVVVERRRTPVAFAMAGFALLTQAAFVHIVRAMAGDAGGLEFFFK